MIEKVRLGWWDLAVPSALVLVGVVELSMLRTTGWVPAIGLEVLAGLALVLRRVQPLVVVPVTIMALFAIPLTGTRMDEAAAPIFFYVLGLYSLGRYLGARRGLVGLGIALALVFASMAVDRGGRDVTDVLFVLSLGIPPYVFGRITLRMAQQSELLARQSEQLRDQAVRDERERIARELHDVIAHSVSAMVVQTAAAQDLLSTDPGRAGTLLESVADTGRRALAETGRMLHLIRDESDELGLSPAPGLWDVAALVDSFRSGGLDVDATLDLPAAPLPGGVDVSAYRVVQEALTNALKYGSGSARLVLDAAGEEVRISLSNPVGRARAHGSGLGLQGMAERVAMLGGTLSHGAKGDLFEVDVAIPVPSS